MRARMLTTAHISFESAAQHFESAAACMGLAAVPRLHIGADMMLHRVRFQLRNHSLKQPLLTGSSSSVPRHPSLATCAVGFRTMLCWHWREKHTHRMGDRVRYIAVCGCAVDFGAEVRSPIQRLTATEVVCGDGLI